MNAYSQDMREALERTEAPVSHIAVERRFEEGNPPDVIVAVADEVRADLIVMGTHGYKGLSHAVMGSVAEQVVRKAPCPVLTLRAKK
jgi:nucleotide-binding universal stress UspA family protein